MRGLWVIRGDHFFYIFLKLFGGGRKTLGSLHCLTFLSVLGPSGYQKRLSHEPLVLDTPILVPFRAKAALFMPNVRYFSTLFINFLVKTVP